MDDYSRISQAKLRSENALSRAQLWPAQFAHADMLRYLDSCENMLHANDVRDQTIDRLALTVKATPHGSMFKSMPCVLALGNFWLDHYVLMDTVSAHETAYKAL